jgi:hypothetical protein
MIEEEISCSQSSSSSSSSSKDWSGYPIIIGRGECFNSNRHIHIEDRNPDIIAHDLSAFAWGRNNINIKITVNNIEIPMRSGNLDNLREDIIATIENEKHHFFKKGDFEIC